MWAVRGGGGSTWGLITSLTLKTHPLPRGGYIGFQIGAVGDFCTGQKDFLTIIEAYLAWTLPLSSKWGGYAIFTPYPTTGRPCELEWAIEIAYVYQGGDDSAVDTWQALVSSIPKAVESASGYAHYEHLWDMIKDEKVEAIIPVPYLAPSDSYAGAIPSVLLSRETVESGALLGLIEKQVAKCTPVHCETWEFSQDLTGNINSPQDSEVSVSPGMRSALLHLMVGASAQDTPLYYALGPYSYFSESAYEMEDWKERYWGRKNYRRLEKIKREFDEDNVFWCRHCVGDQMDLNTTH
uniref:Berberine/berberine-like domain-containing protein n=1 Tax=Arcella intermedia TaxID=1963864 RepID=A0A6B2LBB9_9EUKA